MTIAHTSYLIQGLALETRSPQIDGVLKALLSKLEKEKTTVTLGEGDSQYCENFAITVFTRADRTDRAGRADKNTAMTFYAASIFFEVGSNAHAYIETSGLVASYIMYIADKCTYCPCVRNFSFLSLCSAPHDTAELLCPLQILNQFKTLEADLVDMQRYAAWKAADIRKALREGRTPTPGAPGDDFGANSAASGEQTINWHNFLLSI